MTIRASIGIRIAITAAICLGLARSAMALPVYVQQDATYRYINATTATTMASPADWYTYGFDDSGWFEDSGPFSSSDSSTFGADLANVDDPFDGSAPPLPSSASDYIRWDPNFDPLVRTEFFLSAPTDLTIWIALDNGIGPSGMFLNGVEATASVNLEGQAFRWEHVFDVSSEYTYAGRNTLALNLEDHGGATAFAMVVTAGDVAENPVFTDNPPPPPVPEPATGLLVSVGLAGLALRRRNSPSAGRARGAGSGTPRSSAGGGRARGSA